MLLLLLHLAPPVPAGPPVHASSAFIHHVNPPLAVSAGTTLRRAAVMQMASSAVSPRAKRLESMLEAVAVSDRVLSFIKTPQERMLLQGVRASLEEPAVLEAFTILYEDVAPVRLAGDLIFKTLNQRVSEASSNEQKLQASLRYSETELLQTRRLFDLVDRDGSGSIDREELQASGLLRAQGKSIDELMREVRSDCHDFAS